MLLGVMTKVFERPSVEEVARAIREAGLRAVQLNLESAGLEELPAALDEGLCARVGEAFDRQGIAISAVSGTFNAIHPDPAVREEGVGRVGLLASRCRLLGTEVITQCTGTRDPGWMWRAHADNALPEAWADCLATFRALVPHAEAHDVTLAFEPEVVNVVDTAEKAARLIETIGSPKLRVVMDPANYFHPWMLAQMREVLTDAFAHLGGYIALAHAKDVCPPEAGESECTRPAAGTGILDYALYASLLRENGFSGGLIMHSLREEQVFASKVYVEQFL
ncbi:MAG: sugar phosphate isomerase/epimerase family protein [Anaerolineae bacterium]